MKWQYEVKFGGKGVWEFINAFRGNETASTRLAMPAVGFYFSAQPMQCGCLKIVAVKTASDRMVGILRVEELSPDTVFKQLEGSFLLDDEHVSRVCNTTCATPMGAAGRQPKMREITMYCIGTRHAGSCAAEPENSVGNLFGESTVGQQKK